MGATVENPLPTFVVIGAQKAGTHWIRDNLRAHPDVFMPETELHVFTRPEAALESGPDAYRQAFAGWAGEPLVGEATPGYLMWKHRPEAMACAIDTLVPDVRLIAMIRNPVDRAFSAFVHFRRLGQIPPDVTDLRTALRRAGTPEEDELGLITGGWYAACLRPYIERFGTRLEVLLFDDLLADPAGVYEQITAHIGAAAGFRPPDVEQPRFAYNHADFGVAPLDAAERRDLFAAFADDIAELEGLLDRDLSVWRPPASDGEVRSTAPATLDSPRLVDLGCGDGGSLIDACNRFDVEGIGIEIDLARVERARQRGLDVRLGDILDLDPSAFAGVEIVSLDNVLEHLSGLDDIEVALDFACAVASELVYIRHPSFEDIDYLADLGVKLHWTDWPTMHTAPARLHELVAIINRLGRYDITVRPQGRIRDAADELVLPLGAPPNQIRPDPAVPSVYREDRDGPKPTVTFDRPVYQMFEIEIWTGDASHRPAAPGGGAIARNQKTVPGHAHRWWLGQLRSTVGCDPVVVEQPGGSTVVVEGGMVRPVSGTILARALKIRFGSTTMAPSELARMRNGPPVALLKPLGKSAFVVVGGRRWTMPGMGMCLHASEDWLDAFEEDQPLDPVRAAAELHDERRRSAQ